MLVSKKDGFAYINGDHWKGKTVAVIASGPSLTKEDAEICSGIFPCLAVNDAYLFAPFSESLYFADNRWREWHAARAEYLTFKGQKISIVIGHKQPDDVFVLKNYLSHIDLSHKPDGVASHGSSGYQAINIAYLSGAKRIILLGFDSKLGQGNKEHFFGSHPEKTSAAWLRTLPVHFQGLSTALAKAGVEVINCTRDTALYCFKRLPLEDVINEYRGTRQDISIGNEAGANACA